MKILALILFLLPANVMSAERPYLLCEDIGAMTEIYAFLLNINGDSIPDLERSATFNALAKEMVNKGTCIEAPRFKDFVLGKEYYQPWPRVDFFLVKAYMEGKIYWVALTIQRE